MIAIPAKMKASSCPRCSHKLRPGNNHPYNLCWLCQRELNAHGPLWDRSKKLKAWVEGNFPKVDRCVVCDEVVPGGDPQEGRCPHCYNVLLSRRQNIGKAQVKRWPANRAGEPAPVRALQVESGIPVPESTGEGRPFVYPWTKMAVGDSFWTPNTKASSSAYCFAARHPGVRFTTRREGDGLRIWRVA